MNDQLVDQYAKSDLSNVGTSLGGKYNRHGQLTAGANQQDCCVDLCEKNVHVYGLFCGFHNGKSVAEYCMNRIIYEIFANDPIQTTMSPDQIKKCLVDKMKIVVNKYDDSMEQHLSDWYIGNESGLLDKGKSDTLRAKISQSCSILVVVLIDRDVYVVNIGSSQAILIGREANKISVSHDVTNTDECERLSKLGVNPEKVTFPTRTVGNYFLSNFSANDATLKDATSSPVISTPDIRHYQLEDSDMCIVLISEGVIENLQYALVEDIPNEVMDRVNEQRTHMSMAQCLVDAFGRKHMEAFMRYQQENPQEQSYKKEMSLVYVKLPQKNMDFNNSNSIDNSLSITTQNAVDLTPIAPYVDIDERIEKSAHLFEKFFVSSTSQRL